MKRVFSIVLSIVLALTIIPFYAGAESSSEIKVGDSIEFGSYYQTSDGNGGFNKEPIKWNVLKVENGKALLLSSKIIDAARYNNTSATVNGYYGNNYAHSEVRKWLIDDFYNSAFTENEKNCILKTTLDNSACATDYNASGSYNKYSSESTTDKVFLLSKNEIDILASKYMNKSVTDYAKSRGFQQIVSTEACNAWLTRTAGNNTFQIYYVQIRWGKWTTYYNWNDDKITVKMGVCPAIWVDIEKINQSNDGLVKGSYIGYLALGYSSKSLKSAQAVLTNQGYKATGIDLNEGTRGRYICCGWMNVSTAEEAIRDIRVYVGGDAPDTFLLNGCTYEKVGAASTSICYPGKNGDGAFDLNFKAGGDYLYLYATRDPKAGAPIRQIDFSFEPVKTEWNTVEYLNFGESEPANFNKGAGGATVYMHYYSTDPKSGYGTPEGYNFLEDSYRFVNDESPNIDKKYFSTIFESGTSNLIYKKYHEAGGLCYGFAITTAAIYNGMPDISRFAYLDENIFDVKTATKIRDLKRSNKYITGSAVAIGGNLDDCISLSDYIKYAFIYQYSVEADELLYQTANDTFGLLNTVKNFTNNNRIGVVVGFSRLKNHPDPKAPGGHEVLAVGYDGNDILIDNPNNTKSPERLTIHSDGSWEFGNYNSDNHVLDYATNIQRPYQILLTGNKVVGSDWSGTFGSAEHYVEGVERLDSDYTLVSIDATNFTLNSTDYIQLPENSKDGLGDNDSTAKLFWIKDSKTIKIDGLTDDVNTIEYGGDDTVISAVVSADSTVELTIDGDTKTAAVNTEKDKINTLSFSVVDDDGNKKGVEISGTASGDLVTAKKTENGITVDGFNDMTITYLKDEEEVSDKKADVKDGREVNITVDDKNETVDTDFVPDSAKCKFCGKVHGDSFIELFVKFFHKIFYLISKLFK